MMATYRISYRNGTIEEVIADWAEHLPNAARLMRKRKDQSSAPWPEGEDRGGELVALVPLDIVEMIERVDVPVTA